MGVRDLMELEYSNVPEVRRYLEGEGEGGGYRFVGDNLVVDTGAPAGNSVEGKLDDVVL